MKKILICLFAAMLQNASAQVGIAKKALSLQDNNFVGALWEPDATVNYTEENGVGYLWLGYLYEYQ